MKRFTSVALTGTFLGILLLFDCARLPESGVEAVRLTDAYSDLDLYWVHLANAIGISPTEGRIKEWALSYDKSGAVEALRLVVYVDGGPGKCDAYTVTQQRARITEWRRTRLDSPMRIATVPAQQFFQALNAVGYRQLEAHQEISPPIQSWLSTSSGTVNYGTAMHTHVIYGGRIVAAPPAGVTMQGLHGTFQIKAEASVGAALGTPGLASDRGSTASKPGDSPPLYLLPEAGCFPESSGAREGVRVWNCPEMP